MVTQEYPLKPSVFSDLKSRVAVWIYLLQTALEAIAGVVFYLFRGSCKETPSVRCQDTAFNRQVLSQCPSLKEFSPSPWAPGPVSQTVLGMVVASGSSQYTRTDIVEAPDGVQLLLDWKERQDMAPDTPVFIILHGIGGSSDSRLARHLSDVAVQQGWRAVAYNRRGHGQSTLLPGPPRLQQPEDKSVQRALSATQVLLTPLAMLSKAIPRSVSMTMVATASSAAAVVSNFVAAGEPAAALPDPVKHMLPGQVHVPALFRGLLPSQVSVGLASLAVTVTRRRSSRSTTHDDAVRVLDQTTVSTVTCTASTAVSAACVDSQQAQGRAEPAPSACVRYEPTSAVMAGLEAAVSSGSEGVSCTISCTTSTSCDSSVDDDDIAAATDIIKAGNNNYVENKLVALHGMAGKDNNRVQSSGALLRANSHVSSAVHDEKSGVAGQQVVGRRHTMTSWSREMLQQVRQVFPAHSGTDDLAEVISHIHQQYPQAPLVALGFSQGSNVLVQYLGEHAEGPNRTPLTAAISVSNAYDVSTGVRELRKDWITNAVVTRPLKGLLQKEMHAVQALVKARGLTNIDLKKALDATDIAVFDSAMAAPAHGFTNVEDYYNSCTPNSSRTALQRVSIPLLLVNNVDDPIIHPSLPRIAQEAAMGDGKTRTSGNANLVSVCTHRGGHLGWLQGWKGKHWITDLAMQYATAAVQAVRHNEPAGACVSS